MKRASVLLIFFAFPLWSFSQETSLQGIFLYGDKECRSECQLEDIRGVEVCQLGAPIDPWQIEYHLQGAFGEAITLESIERVKKELLQTFRNLGYPFVLIQTPEQEVTQGVLQFKVTFGHVDQITCKGNRWFSDSQILSSMRLKPGAPICTDTLLEDLAWINRNPFRHVNAIIAPGSKPYTSDLELMVKDRFLLRTYGGGDNTGTQPLGLARFFGGFDWAQSFMLNQILSYQFTSGASYPEFNSHTIHWTTFLPWRHILVLYGGYAHFNPKITGIKKMSGHNGQGSLRYEILLGPSYKNVTQEVQLGFDIKNFNNFLPFEEQVPVAVTGKTVNVTQLVGGYTLSYQEGSHKFSGQVLAFFSPGPIIANQSNSDFEGFQPGAKNNYYYEKFYFNYVYTPFQELEFSTWARGQWTTRVLLPSEQFSIGGYDTVRGYQERLYNGDRGVCGNFEIRGKWIRFPSRFKDKTVETQVTILAFMDVGYAQNVIQEEDVDRHATLWSVGPGVRYKFGTTIEGRLDFGFQLFEPPVSIGSNFGRFHGGAMISF
ncbi:MAG: ShlB/FhaC/HecB family hemolysin secretion/activation protein [Verrucomicrobia bacterium]|nr:ShlB/FhaC/HecB family hemolysin secretion/activation protein [Verrucomicrobiota bacterium]